MISLFAGWWRHCALKTSEKNMNDDKIVSLEEGRIRPRYCHVNHFFNEIQEIFHYEFDVSNSNDDDEVSEDGENIYHNSLNIELMIFRSRDNPEKTRVDRATFYVHRRDRLVSEMADPEETIFVPPTVEFVIDIKSSILFSEYPEKWWKPWRFAAFFKHLFEINGIDQEIGVRIFDPLGKCTNIMGLLDNETRDKAIRVHSEFFKRVGNQET
jgi:hypothetical protein